jgi:hypothetical protein
MVVETNWPAVCSGVTLSEKFPVSAAGQSQWLNEVKNIVNGLPNGRGTGLLYWEPGWIGNANLGSSCSVSSCIILTQLRIAKVDTSGRLARRPVWKYPLKREHVRCLTSQSFDLALDGSDLCTDPMHDGMWYFGANHKISFRGSGSPYPAPQ